MGVIYPPVMLASRGGSTAGATGGAGGVDGAVASVGVVLRSGVTGGIGDSTGCTGWEVVSGDTTGDSAALEGIGGTLG